ncbi:MAG: glycosyltransferase family 4 protein [Thermoplasmata archaeon]
MRILHVIHGFPPHYMAGSEVYTHNLCRELAKANQVWVFSRMEDPYAPLYSTARDQVDGIEVTRMNKPPRDYTFRGKFVDEKADEVFDEYISGIDPDIAHIGHLSHLSTNLVRMLKERGIPIVMTLHDFWLMCLRGQLLTSELRVCDDPSTEGCTRCFAQYFLSDKEAREKVSDWEQRVKEVVRNVDFYIAPSRFLRSRFVEWGIPGDKIAYMDYGFDTSLFRDFRRKESDVVRFGFTGRIIPAKGVDILINAFNDVESDGTELRIHGALPPSSKYLARMVKSAKILFEGPYDNREVASVMSRIDVLVVPSIWFENSPLVIHEAFLTNTPVIASDIGGMAEYVDDGKNGLLFRVGDVDDLKEKITMLIEDSALRERLSSGGGQVRTIQEDASAILNIYERLTRQETAA